MGKPPETGEDGKWLQKPQKRALKIHTNARGAISSKHLKEFMEVAKKKLSVGKRRRPDHQREGQVKRGPVKKLQRRSIARSESSRRGKAEGVPSQLKRRKSCWLRVAGKTAFPNPAARRGKSFHHE